MATPDHYWTGVSPFRMRTASRDIPQRSGSGRWSKRNDLPAYHGTPSSSTVGKNFTERKDTGVARTPWCLSQGVRGKSESEGEREEDLNYCNRSVVKIFFCFVDEVTTLRFYLYFSYMVRVCVFIELSLMFRKQI